MIFFFYLNKKNKNKKKRFHSLLNFKYCINKWKYVHIKKKKKKKFFFFFFFFFNKCIIIIYINKKILFILCLKNISRMDVTLLNILMYIIM